MCRPQLRAAAHSCTGSALALGDCAISPNQGIPGGRDPGPPGAEWRSTVFLRTSKGASMPNSHPPCPKCDGFDLVDEWAEVPSRTKWFVCRRCDVPYFQPRTSADHQT